MIKRSRFFIMFLLAAAFIFIDAGVILSQSKGIKLYEKLSNFRSRINKWEGPRRLIWTPDGSGYILQEGNTFKKVDPANGKKTSLFEDAKIIAAYNKLTGATKKKLPFKRYNFIEKGTKIQFFEDNSTKVFFYTLKTGKLNMYKVRTPVIGVRGMKYPEEFSPNYKYTAYARDYNLFMRDIEKDKEIQITFDGHEDLRNAWPDWVYPEELGQYKVFWWSPDSKYIAFMQFDESPVSKYPIPNDANIPTTLYMESYPKAGANNPIVRFFIVDISTKKIVEVDTGLETNVYNYGGQWTNGGKEFTFKRMNRWQNKIELLSANPANGKSHVILKEEEKCYIDGKQLIFIKNSTQFLWTSEVSGWNEIYLYGLDGKLIKQLTDKKLPVGRIMTVDEKNGWVYFTGYEKRGCDQHLFRIKLNGSGFKKLTKKSGWHGVSVSPGGKFFSDNFSSWDDPPEFKVYKGNGKFITQLGKTIITEEFKNLKLKKPEHFTFKSADDKDIIDGILYFPANFDKNKKYPVYYSVYGGPGARMITNRWNQDGRDVGMAQLGFLVLRTDHSGVSRRGKVFQTKSYLKLGEVDLNDHIAAVKHISKRKYVDSKRVGITGHSYGGYMTCIALLKAPEYFHVGVSGAPVTDWRNYDSIYTERFMRRPQDNLKGYDDGSCMKYAKNLKGKLQLHHGLADDNVHPGNTIQLVKALLKAGKRFDWKMYPEQKHGIRFAQYGKDRMDFMIKHLSPETKEEWFKKK